MIKQRFVVYKAFDKYGDFQRLLQVVGGSSTALLSNCGNIIKEETRLSTLQILECLGYPHFKSVKEWKDYAKSQGACRFQKVIYFN